MDNQPNDVKYKALETSIYCPKFVGTDQPIDSIELDEFDPDIIINHIKNSVDLLSYNQAYKPIMIEIINVIDHYKDQFLINYQKYISFYWNGIFVYRISINKEVNHDKQLHISVPTYKKRKYEIQNEEMTTKLLFGGFGASLLVGAILIGINLFKKGD